MAVNIGTDSTKLPYCYSFLVNIFTLYIFLIEFLPRYIYIGTRFTLLSGN